MGARETALSTLIACRRQGGWSNAVLKDTVRRDRLDGREAALATRLCYGVLQNSGRLDFYLKQLLKGKLKSLHPATRDILHLGLYQIYDLDRVPDSAAVNESVVLAKKYAPPESDGAGQRRSSQRRPDQGKAPGANLLCGQIQPPGGIGRPSESQCAEGNAGIRIAGG